MPPLAVPPPPPVPAVERPAARAAAAPVRTSRMLVYASEFRLNPSRRVITAGRLILQVKNIGEDDHNLVIRAANGHVLKATPVILPGGLETLRVRLTPGRYWLVCTIPGHEAHGMVRSFTVRKPPVRRR